MELVRSDFGDEHSMAFSEMRQGQEIVDYYSSILREERVAPDILLVAKVALAVAVVKQQDAALSISKELGERWMVKELRSIRNKLVHATDRRTLLLENDGGAWGWALQDENGQIHRWDTMRGIMWQAVYLRNFLLMALANRRGALGAIEYRGYVACVYEDDTTGMLHGQVVGARDGVTIEGNSREALAQAFRVATDEHLRVCADSDRSYR